LEPVRLSKEDTIHELLTFYMGKNTPDRQNFIIDNLRFEEDYVEEEEELVAEVIEEVQANKAGEKEKKNEKVTETEEV
ncbi:MAG: hypothetical protein ACOCWA_10565, partial [Bacteroidota bacterium]